MQPFRLSLKIILLMIGLAWFGQVYADPTELGNDFYQDKTKVVGQQIELLKNRLKQSQKEFAALKVRQDTELTHMMVDDVSKQRLNWAKLDIAIAKSNLDSLNIELTESLQTLNLLQKDTQEIENQLNVYNVIGLKMVHAGIPNLTVLRSELTYQKTLLKLEKTRCDYLYKLQTLATDTLQIYTVRFNRIETLLKSQTMLQLKEQQAKYEIDFEDQQRVWLEHLNNLYVLRKDPDYSKAKNTHAYTKLQNDIFYANENMNFLYLQMLIVRYQEQIQQLKVSISESSSFTLLNKMSEQTQILTKQFARVRHLLLARNDILINRQSFYAQDKFDHTLAVAEITDLQNQYAKALKKIDKLSNELAYFRVTLDQALQQELSARQGLVGFSMKAWLDLGNELIIVPTLAFQLIKNLTEAVIKSLHNGTLLWWLTFGFFESVWILLVYTGNRLLGKYLTQVKDHESGHINLKWLGAKLLHRNLMAMAIIGNVFWFFSLCRIPSPYYHFLINIALVGLFFKMITLLSRLCLVESVHDRTGKDVRLYECLKWTFCVGGLITMVTVFLHQLPLIYEIKDLFYRLFLLFLLIVCALLLRSQEIISSVILPYIDEKQTYIRRIVRLLGVIIPFVIMVNAAIGLFGFIYFILTISWYEGIFLLVLIGYLIIRGLLGYLMDYTYRVMIRHVQNGWLWTEAFLKPLDKLLRLVLVLMAIFVLFFLYQWDSHSLVVASLDKLLHYQLIAFLNTVITPLSLIELIVISSMLYWSARWTREFVYRFLLSRTKDLGIRNSIAILSQYFMIVIGFLIGLRVLGIDLQALTFVISALALGIGLGLRDLANNFACGFLLLLERPLRVGDTVTLGGHEGEVMHIGGRAVTIRTWDHMEVLVPNAEIFSKTFVNWTAKDYVVRSVITLKIHRHDSPQDVQALIYQTLSNHKNVLSDPAPEVFLKEIMDEFIEFEVRYFVNLCQIRSRISVRSDVLMTIWTVFEKHGVKHPFPHHEVHIKTDVSNDLPLLTGPTHSK